MVPSPFRAALICLLVVLTIPSGGFSLPTQPASNLGKSASPYSSHLMPVRTKKTPSTPSRQIANIRFHDHTAYTRVVLDFLSRPKFTRLEEPDARKARIELPKTVLARKALARLNAANFPEGLQITTSPTRDITITIDLAKNEKYSLLTLGKPYRVVVDLYPRTAQASQETTSLQAPSPDQQPLIPTSPPIPARKRPHEVVVVLDPGHGGKDPGAIGKKGTKEKHITLQIATRLKELIAKRLGATVLMTRDEDRFLELEQRVEFANARKADLFVSIHVNSHPEKSVRGIELYHFGIASDPRALEVAARENGTPLEDNSPDWQFILADKLIDQKIDESRTLAWTTREALTTRLKQAFRVKDHGVKTAPFYVLRYTTMPGILAEVAFVSNPTEEQHLRSSSYQAGLAEGIFNGIRAYLKSAALPVS